MRARVPVGADTIEFEMSDGEAHLDGEFAGNVDVTVRLLAAEDPEAARKALLSGLLLAPVGADFQLTVHGYERGDREFGLTFAGALERATPDGNGSAAILWKPDDSRLGTIALRPAAADPTSVPAVGATKKAGCGAAAVLVFTAIATLL
jgi:hypothetical protein